MNKWTQIEKDFLIENYALKSREFLHSVLSAHTPGSITVKANELGLKRDRYVKNIDMSKLHTQQFAYMLGFIWADGYLSKKKNFVKIEIQERDGEEIFNILKQCGNWTHKVYNKTYQGVTRKYSTLILHDKEFLDFLSSYGFREKSTKFSHNILHLLGPELSKCFIRGYFDGDGNISKLGHRITMISSYDYIWDDFENYFDEYYGQKWIFAQRILKNGRHSILYANSIQFFLFFYENFVYNIPFGLSRKTIIFLKEVERLKQDYNFRKLSCSSGEKFNAQITHQRKCYFIGTFDNPEDAKQASFEKHKEINTHFYQIYSKLQTV